MELKKLTCPYCHGNIHIDKDQEGGTVYCNFCGQSLHVDDGHKRKTITVNKFDHKRITNDADVIRAQAEANEQKRNSKSGKWALVAFVLVFVMIFTIPYVIHRRHIAKLERLVTEVEELIAEGEYSKARIKAMEIVDDSDWSDDSEKKWNGIRKNLLEEINKAEKQAKEEAERREKEELKLAIIEKWQEEKDD